MLKHRVGGEGDCHQRFILNIFQRTWWLLDTNKAQPPPTWLRESKDTTWLGKENHTVEYTKILENGIMLLFCHRNFSTKKLLCNLAYRRWEQQPWSRYLFILLKQIYLVLTVMISMAYSLGFYRHTEQLKVWKEFCAYGVCPRNPRWLPGSLGLGQVPVQIHLCSPSDYLLWVEWTRAAKPPTVNMTINKDPCLQTMYLKNFVTWTS